MTTKPKPHPLNGMHTAGIFSDMSVDGPDIGTLVVVVDRAKNLPNRKTIGKQDPYCAARLGKEARKTTTDIRGGQTPKWDQELRFTVHDSPDYYQLKLSVFNDDKKTELIGEAWIDLRDIIVPGGGQSDQWHQLGCKGKYAGEVRIEITYYDTRPKPEKPVVKAKPTPATAEAEASPSATGPRVMPKRRPLPSDPVTGKASTTPSPGPEIVDTTPRHSPNPASLQQPEYSPNPPTVTQAYYQQQADYYPTRQPSGDFGTPSRRADVPQQFRTPERIDSYGVQPDEQNYSPHFSQPVYGNDHYEFAHADNSRAPGDDRPPPPPAHRSRTGSNPPANATFHNGFDISAKGTPLTMRQDVLRNEAHRHSASEGYPGRPTYKAYDSAPPALVGYANTDQPSPPRHYSYDSGFDIPHRTRQPTVEDVPESPEALNNPFRRSVGRLPSSQSQAQYDQSYDMTASPAPLNLGGRGGSAPAQYAPIPPDQPRHQGSNGYQVPSFERDVPGSSQEFGRRSEPALLSQGTHADSGDLTYRTEPDSSPNVYSVPPVPPSLVPGIDPNLALEISSRINQDRQQSVSQTRRYTQQAMVETPPRGRTMDHLYDQALVETPSRGRAMDHRYDQALVEAQPRGRNMEPQYNHDVSPASYNVAPAHSKSLATRGSGPSTSSVNVVIRQRAFSPNPPVRDASPGPNHQHTIRRKSVSPRPPPSNDRRLSGIPFGPDSYDALNPSASSAAVKDTTTSRPDYDETSGKIITHDGRHVDPSDHLPMETWAPEPEPKPGSSVSSSSRPSLTGPQPPPSSGRRPLRVGGRPQSMLPSSSGYAATDHVEQGTPSPSSTGRNRLQKKAAYRQSTSAVSGPMAPMMSGANGPGVGPSGFRRSSGAGGGSGVEVTPLAPIPPHQDNFTPPRHIPRAATFDSYGAVAGSSGGSENYAPNMNKNMNIYGGSPGSSSNNRGAAPALPAKVPLALPPPSSASFGGGGGGGGGGNMSATSGALQLHSSSLARRGETGFDDGYDVYGNGGGQGLSSLEEELRQIDIGTGRSSRRHHAAAGAHAVVGPGGGHGGGGGGGYGQQHNGYGYAHAHAHAHAGSY
ncbi:hypothetical protein N656DRAFT_778232 [Canariomyces notabilis]|uniref:C2 domain-containing protein n=1 Tax=Canariomyces notabilis TaxID=2074819 RepID=A0AAN6TFE7_9PEZI|nr:hypothetical protein N656DRAFT_778232 [Canariomyces arenarius]